MHTIWICPNTAYESAVRDFIAVILRRGPDNEFLPDLERFSLSISVPGLWNSLSQVVLKLTCPGVPDIFQGAELWDFSLVDPDNRRPVDYTIRKRLLSKLPVGAGSRRKEWLSDAIRTLQDGRLKLYITACIARFRRANEHFFREAGYIPLEPTGERRNHIVSFARRLPDTTVIVVAARFFAKLGCRTSFPTGDEVWQDSRLTLWNDSPERHYRDLLSGTTVEAFREGDRWTLPISPLLSSLPVALLISEPPSGSFSPSLRQ